MKLGDDKPALKPFISRHCEMGRTDSSGLMKVSVCGTD